ncbi:hypothetical protein M885DRAFT_512859 [Pelagophyceae sp. CCMP2097]|nr:hypothetical protein M885DRAFT_512859 [Pelagophyceae sp. CCMP2097]
MSTDRGVSAGLLKESHRVFLDVRSDSGWCCAAGGALDDDSDRSLPSELADYISATEWASIVETTVALEESSEGKYACILGPVLGAFLPRLLLERRIDDIATQLNARFEGRGIIFSRGRGDRRAAAEDGGPRPGDGAQCLAVEVEPRATKRVIKAVSLEGNVSLLAVPRSSRSSHDIHSLIAGAPGYAQVEVGDD